MNKKLIATAVPAALFVGVSVLFVISESLRELMVAAVGEPSLLNYSLFVLTLAVAVVAMPLTAMPLVPIGTLMFGPFVTALLSIAGWTLGAVGAFLVARLLGEHILSKYVDLEPIDTLLADYPVQTRFLIIILIRLTIPVDIGSYALGFTKQVRLGEYIVATLIGVSWFSFAFAYMGDTLLRSDVLGLIAILGVSALVFSLAYLYLQRIRRKENSRKSED